MTPETDLILNAINKQTSDINDLKADMGELKDVVVTLARVEERQVSNDKEAHEAFQRVYTRVEKIEKDVVVVKTWQDKNGYLVDIGKKVVLGVITTGIITAIVLGLTT